jgi:hypothetical protein
MIVGDKVVFWLWVASGVIAVALAVFWIYAPIDLLFENSYHNWFQSIIPMTAVFMIVSWGSSLLLTIKATKTRPISDNPWWMVGSVGWCIASPFLFAFLTFALVFTSTPKLH